MSDNQLEKITSAHLKSLRTKMGFKNLDIAKTTRIDKGFLGNIERGDRSANYEILYKLSRFYNITIDEIMDIDYENLMVAENIKIDEEKKGRELLKARLRFLNKKEFNFVMEVYNNMQKYLNGCEE